MLRNRSWPAVSQKSVTQKQLRMTQLIELCFSHNLHPGGKAQPTCSETQTELHLTNLKHLRVKKLWQTGTFPYWAQLWAVLALAINKGEATSDTSCVAQQDQDRQKCTEQ